MKEVTVCTVIPAPSVDVFSVIPDPRGPFFVKNRFACTTILGNQTEGIGTVYRWDFHLPLGFNYHFDEVVTEWKKPERFAYKTISGPYVISEIVLEPKPGGTLVSFTLKYNIIGLLRFFVPPWLVKIGARKGLKNIHRSIKAKLI